MKIATGIGGVVIVLGEGAPSLRGLTLYIGLAGIALGIERVELLFQAMLGGFAGIDGAANRFDRLSCHGGHYSQRICRTRRHYAASESARRPRVANGSNRRLNPASSHQSD